MVKCRVHDNMVSWADRTDLDIRSHLLYTGNADWFATRIKKFGGGFFIEAGLKGYLHESREGVGVIILSEWLIVKCRFRSPSPIILLTDNCLWWLHASYLEGRARFPPLQRATENQEYALRLQHAAQSDTNTQPGCMTRARLHKSATSAVKMAVRCGSFPSSVQCTMHPIRIVPIGLGCKWSTWKS